MFFVGLGEVSTISKEFVIFFALVIILLPDIVLFLTHMRHPPEIIRFNERAVYSLLISYNSTCPNRYIPLPL